MMASRSHRSLPPLILGLGLALGLAGLAWSRPAGDQAPPQVHTQQGLLQGSRAVVHGVPLDEFRGIPFAAPPIGALRWKPPQPPHDWSGTRAATQFGPRCMQLPIYSDMVFRSSGVSEDCLHLNVWTPARARGAGKLPVLVYFFGGGFVAGDASEPRYDGASLATRGIVTVTVSYRLGVFGFLALPALADESPHHAAGNYGLLDQVAALKWVGANIAQFGGDPHRITIGGESAGSISVSALMTSPLSRHLIAGAIGESGALIAPVTPFTANQAQARGTAFMHQLGATSLAQLRALPAAELLKASDASFRFQDDAMPDIDGWFLTETAARTLERGAQAQVPLLLGSNSQEGDWPAILGQLSPTPAHYRAALQRLFGDQSQQALTLYPGISEAQVKQSAAALAGDMFIAHSTWRWMALNRTSNTSPTWFYYFDQPRPRARDAAVGTPAPTGAVHSGEIEYALGNLAGNQAYAWTDADRQTSRQMEGYFARFIKTGNPNGGDLPHWPAATGRDGGVLRQVIDPHSHTEVDRGAARQEFLTRWYAAHPANDG